MLHLLVDAQQWRAYPQIFPICMVLYMILLYPSRCRICYNYDYTLYTVTEGVGLEKDVVNYH